MPDAVNPGRRPVIARSVPRPLPFTQRIHRPDPATIPRRPVTCGFSRAEMQRDVVGHGRHTPPWSARAPVAARMALRHLSGTNSSGGSVRPRFVHSVGTTLWTNAGTRLAAVRMHAVEEAVGGGGQLRCGCGT